MSATVDISRASRDTLSMLRSAIDKAAIAGERISTGKAVNSALENPARYFTADALSNRASEIDRTLEQVAQGIQVVKAADQGISTIRKLIDSGRTLVSRAAESQSAFDRRGFAAEFNKILEQMTEVAADSSYRGKNLLLGPGHDLKLYFGDETAESITIPAVDYTDPAGSLGLAALSLGSIAIAESRLTAGSTPLQPADFLATSGDIAVGDRLTVTAADGTEIAALEVRSTTRVSDLLAALDRPDAGLRASIDGSGTLRVESLADVTLGGSGGLFAGTRLEGEPSAWQDPAATAGTEEAVKAAIETLRLQATTFGTNLTMLQNRESFMKVFSGTMSAGAEQLVAADVNEEGANLLALTVRQQFSSNAMSFALQADQGILKLLGS